MSLPIAVRVRDRSDGSLLFEGHVAQGFSVEDMAYVPGVFLHAIEGKLEDFVLQGEVVDLEASFCGFPLRSRSLLKDVDDVFHVVMEDDDDNNKLHDAIGLYMTRESITKIPRVVHLAHHHLKELRLIKCKLMDVPSEVTECVALETLDLRWNALSALPPQMATLTRLQHLMLQDNSFRDFPVPLCSMTWLQSLALSNNRISQLPSCVSQLRHVLTLDLSLNPISSSFAPLCSMLHHEHCITQSLVLNGCRLTPESFFAICSVLPTSLTCLNVSGNVLSEDCFSSLCSSLSRLSQLTSLSCQGCHLNPTTFSSLLQRVSHLHHLDVRFNNVGHEGAIALCHLLESTHSLRSLKAYGLHLSEQDMEAVLSAVQKNWTLTTGEVLVEMTGAKGMMKEVMKRNESLQNVVIHRCCLVMAIHRRKKKEVVLGKDCGMVVAQMLKLTASDGDAWKK